MQTQSSRDASLAFIADAIASVAEQRKEHDTPDYDTDLVVEQLQALCPSPHEILNSSILNAIESCLPANGEHQNRQWQSMHDRYMHEIEALTGARIPLHDPTITDLKLSLEILAGGVPCCSSCTLAAGADE